MQDLLSLLIIAAMVVVSTGAVFYDIVRPANYYNDED